ncbi:MAG: zinc-binding dehydrogenase [Chloroflexi bacterium]|nr:zinc-binding dehydrogenase [Chloroflexota bacterium]
MKAIVFHKRGGLENLKYADVPMPQVGARDALIKIRACGLNHLDIFTREGSHGVHAPLPHIGGLEPAGEIAELGSDVRDWRVGDRVLVGSAITCGACEFCARGSDNLCTRRKVIGVNIPGGFAEYICVPASILLPIPDAMSFVDAAASPTAFGTAWHMLVSRAAIAGGEWVLIHAAGSNVGVAGIQVAKHFGARVIATASTAEKLAKAKELGADFVINYVENNFQHAVMQITDNRGVDVVFEHVGTTTWERSIAALHPTGRLVTCGSTTGRWGNTDIWSVFFKQISILGSFAFSSAEMRAVWQLVAQKIFNPVIDRAFPLAETAAAQKYLQDRKQFGKVVVVN